MGAARRAIARIEELSGRDIQQRNIGPLVNYARGSLAAAAASIAAHPRPSIAIITGFFLEDGEPPNCETDGPPGAAMLAAGFISAGIPCRIATDLVNARVVCATVAAVPDAQIPIDIVSMHQHGGDGGTLMATIGKDWRSGAVPISHVISIERCGPSRDGRPRNSRGKDIAGCTAPLQELFGDGAWTTIGIGDLGNEIGMGSIPYELVAASVPNGGDLWCPIACDYPIIGGISNWAASALLGAVALQRPAWAEALLTRMSEKFAYRLLEAAVRDGAAVSSDGVGPPRPRLSVDGLPWHALAGTFCEIVGTCRAGLQ